MRIQSTEYGESGNAVTDADAAELVEGELNWKEDLATILHQGMEENLVQDLQSKELDATQKLAPLNQVQHNKNFVGQIQYKYRKSKYQSC